MTSFLLITFHLVRDSEMNGRKIYVIKFTDIEMEELMNKSIIDKPSDKLLIYESTYP